MKKLLIITSFFITSVSLASNAINIEFKSVNGKIYHTKSLHNNIEKNDGFRPGKPKVLLIETLNCANPSFIEQHRQLESIGHQNEEYELMFVSACLDKQYKHGYSISVKSANRLNSDKKAFRVRILDAEGRVMHKSLKPISANTLADWIADMDVR